jgi:serine/threonine protein kinase
MFAFGVDLKLIHKVWLAKDKETGVNYAIKKMLKSHLSKENNKKSVMNERNVLSKCNHPNIVKLYKAFRDDEYFCMFFTLLSVIHADFLDYVISLAPNGELLGYVRKVCEIIQYRYS